VIDTTCTPFLLSLRPTWSITTRFRDLLLLRVDSVCSFRAFSTRWTSSILTILSTWYCPYVIPEVLMKRGPLWLFPNQRIIFQFQWFLINFLIPRRPWLSLASPIARPLLRTLFGIALSHFWLSFHLFGWLLSWLLVVLSGMVLIIIAFFIIIQFLFLESPLTLFTLTRLHIELMVVASIVVSFLT
jgi:hypothetical protein